MLWLYILAVIIFITVLLLFTPVKAKLKYDSELTVTLNYFFIRYKALPVTKKTKTKKESKKKKLKKEKTSFSYLVKTHGLPAAISQITEVLKTTIIHLSKLFKHVKVKNFNLNLGVIGNDAADAAINYGLVCATLYPLLGFLSAAMIFDKPKVNIYCDYDSRSPLIEGKAILSVKVIFLLKSACAVLIALIKDKVTAQKEAAKEKAAAQRIKNIRGGTYK